MFANNHHGDGHVAAWFPAAAGVQAALIEDAPETYFRPPYVGVSGWVGVEACPRRVRTTAVWPATWSAAWQGGRGGRHALRGGLGNSPVGEDAVRTLQEFLKAMAPISPSHRGRQTPSL